MNEQHGGSIAPAHRGARSLPLRFGVALLLLAFYALPVSLVLYFQHAQLDRVAHRLTAQRLDAAQQEYAAALDDRLDPLHAYAESLARSPDLLQLMARGSGAPEHPSLKFDGETYRLRRIEIAGDGSRKVLLEADQPIGAHLIRLQRTKAANGGFISALGWTGEALLAEVSAPLADSVLRVTAEVVPPPEPHAELGASGRMVLAGIDETNTPRVLMPSRARGQIADRDLWRLPFWGDAQGADRWLETRVQERASYAHWFALPQHELILLAAVDRSEVDGETDRVTLIGAGVLLIAGVGLLMGIRHHLRTRLVQLEHGIAAEARRIFAYQPASPGGNLSPSQLFSHISSAHQAQCDEAQRQSARAGELLKQRQADIDEARSLNSHMERELARVARFVELGEVAATVAHDVNQPLTQMRLLIEASSLDPANQGGAVLSDADVSKTQLLIRKITDITVALRDLARDRTQSKKEAMKAAQLAADALLLARVRVKSSLAKVELAGDELVLCLVEPVKIQQVLMNLVVNASDAFAENVTQDARRIRVLWRQVGARVYFMVEDNGGGIAEAIKPKIFDWNFSTKGAEKGSGLGLAICRRIVEAHGGKIDVGDRAGGGAVFSFDVEAAVAASS